MNNKTTHQDWHPMDTEEELAAAIERVRAEVAKASAGLRQKQAQEDYAIGEYAENPITTRISGILDPTEHEEPRHCANSPRHGRTT